MFRNVVSLALCSSISLTPCLAQVSFQRQSPAEAERFVVQDREHLRNYTVTLPLLMEWARARTVQGAYSGYLVGRAFETGQGIPGHRPDLNQAVSWYVASSRAGDVNATYRLGLLLEQKRVLRPDGYGGLRPDPEGGAAMMRWAVNQGYSPATDAVGSPAQRVQQQAPAPSSQDRPSGSDSGITAGEVFGGLLLLGLTAALLSGGSSHDGGGSASDGSSGMPPPGYNRDGSLKTCMTYESHFVPDAPGSGFSGHEEGHYVPKSGIACP